MLLLGRQAGQSLIIDDNIKITVTAIKGGQVRIGIEAPDNIKVYREEIYNRIKKENKEKNNANVNNNHISQ